MVRALVSVTTLLSAILLLAGVEAWRRDASLSSQVVPHPIITITPARGSYAPGERVTITVRFVHSALGHRLDLRVQTASGAAGSIAEVGPMLTAGLSTDGRQAALPPLPACLYGVSHTRQATAALTLYEDGHPLARTRITVRPVQDRRVPQDCTVLPD